ncbi:MAG: hypothetical protein WAO58_02770 [Fimbriimonadaceae bacterium]
MLTAAIALFTFVAQEPQATPRPSELISKMIAHYNKAQTLTGTIKLRQGANGQAAQGSIDTAIQFELPSKLYINQIQNTSDPMRWLITSDGVQFAYDTPEELPGTRRRLVEKVKPRPNETLDVKGIYSAAARSLGDRSAPLEIAIGRPGDLKFFTQQLVTLEYAGRTKIGEEDVHVIRGGWREYQQVGAIDKVTATGTYEIFINDLSDFRRYIVYQSIRPSVNSAIINVVSQWDINLVVNGKPDPALFKVVLK